jgi:hypothetical protein
MTDLEKRLMERMPLVYIVGKRERNVPVLLTPNMKTSMDVLLQYRKNISMIDSDNEYMFPAINSLNHERGHEVLQNMCKEVDIVNKKFITSTRLRKYVATINQLLNLTKTKAIG